MAPHWRLLIFSSSILLLSLPSLNASPFFWREPIFLSNNESTPISRNASTVTISIGNRVNGQAGSTDRGTTIDGLTINLQQWQGNLSLAAHNGSEVLITKGTDGATHIRIDFGGGNTTKVTNSTATTTQSTTISSSRRRKRDLGILPLPSIPIPTMNGSLILFNGNFIPFVNVMPISPTLVKLAKFQQPWETLKTLANNGQSLGSTQMLDSAVAVLSRLYSSTGKIALDTGLNALNATLNFFSGIVNSGLNYVNDQVSSGVAGVVRSYNGLTRAGQTCVGEVPEDSGRRVVSKATGCVRDRWNEVAGLVDEFMEAIAATEEAYAGWLRDMELCNAKNFEGLSESEVNTAQRRCYVQAIADSVSKLTVLPMRWSNLTLRASNAYVNFQPQISLCIAGVGAEAASVSSNIGIKIALCQFIR